MAFTIGDRDSTRRGRAAPRRRSPLHSSGDASRLTALLPGQICPMRAVPRRRPEPHPQRQRAGSGRRQAADPGVLPGSGPVGAPARLRGVVVTHGPRVVAAEVFGAPRTAPAPLGGAGARLPARAACRHRAPVGISKAACRETPGLGLGVERHLGNPKAVGQALSTATVRAPWASFRSFGDSTSRISPSTMNATRSHSSSATVMSCVVRNTVRPACFSSRTRFLTPRPLAGSRPTNDDCILPDCVVPRSCSWRRRRRFHGASRPGNRRRGTLRSRW